MTPRTRAKLCTLLRTAAWLLCAAAWLLCAAVVLAIVVMAVGG